MAMPSSGRKTICLPITSELYSAIVEDLEAFRQYLDEEIAQHPELFPVAIAGGYRFYGMRYSQKQQLRLRRIQLQGSLEVYQLRPDFVMPYMIGKTDEVEKALYLRGLGVSYEALSYVFGRDPMYWYRAVQSLGKFSLVGTTIKSPQNIPLHLVADEKHSWLSGKRVYLPTTVAEGCFLGVEVVPTASCADLRQGYETFAQEALNLNPDYQPITVNTDGWKETQSAWKQLFPKITLILCFLHSILGIVKHLRRTQGFLRQVQDKLWNIYHATTKRQFAQRLRRFHQWVTLQHIESQQAREKLLNLKDKAPQFQVAYDFPEAYRTSNMLDRLMHQQDRVLFAMQYFHGSSDAARLQSRAMALIWNFHPFNSRSRANHPIHMSPFAELNGFVYHHNWLHNLLIAASMNGFLTEPTTLNTFH